MKKITLLLVLMLTSSLAFSQVSIGTGDDGGSFESPPINPYYGFSYGQSIYLASEINATGNITSLNFALNPGADITSADETVDVWIGHTTKSVFDNTTDWIDVAGLSQVLTSGTLTSAGDVLTITFSAPFAYNGTDNLVIALHAPEVGFGGSADYALSTNGPTAAMSLMYRNDTTVADPVAPPTGTLRQTRGNITINGIAQSCPAPTALTATSITGISVNLGWTEAGTASLWNIELVDITGGGLVTGAATQTGVMTNPYNQTGLVANNNYEFYVQADCGVTNGTSSWTGPFSFSTPCTSFTPDYNADMSANVPNCWEEADSGTIATGPSDLGASGWAASNHNGTPSNRINMWLAAKSDWIISPIFDLSAAAASELNVYVALTENGTNGAGANLGSDDIVSLLMTVDGGITWTSMQAWTQGNVPTDVGEEVTYDLSAITGSVQFAFLGDEGAVDDTEDVYFHVSKFQVREVPTCVEPTALTASSITDLSASLGWTENGGVMLWNIELVDITAGGVVTGTATQTGVMANPYNQTGLVAENNYEFYVQADCGVTNGTSSWTGPFSFTTPCASVTTFPSTTDFTNNVPTNCWGEAGAGEVAVGPTGTTSDWRDGRAFEDAGGNVINSNALNLWQTVDREWLISPIFAIPSGTAYGLKVKVAVTNYSFSGTTTVGDTMDSDDEVRLLMTVDSGVTWTTLTTWNATNEPGVNGVDYLADLTAVTGNVQFAVWGSDGTVSDGPDYDFHVGAFTVDTLAALSTESFNTTDLDFSFYPNPVNNNLTINSKTKIASIAIYNVLGQTVKNVKTNTTNVQVDMSDLSQGAYFVKVVSGDLVKTIRVIKN